MRKFVKTRKYDFDALPNNSCAKTSAAAAEGDVAPRASPLLRVCAGRGSLYVGRAQLRARARGKAAQTSFMAWGFTCSSCVLPPCGLYVAARQAFQWSVIDD